jgi:serine/threonine protein kinase
MHCPRCQKQAPEGAKKCPSCGLKFPHDPSAALGETKVLPESGVSGASPFTPGGVIRGHFEVVRELGRGGMGVVYLVRDRLLNGKEYALKAISPVLVDHPEAKERFAREVLAAQELAHENIIRVYNLDEESGQQFFTMEYVPGRSLRELLEERKKESRTFSLEEANKIIQPVLSALEYAHSRRSVVVHRDVKPENIMVEGEFPDIQVNVVDFGLAKILSPSRFTSSAMSMGTAYYMSPEQLGGQSDVDARSDIYSTGVVLYELLAGKIPQGRFPMPCKVNPALPPKVDEIIDRALQLKPDDRYPSAFGIAEALLESLAEERRVREEKESERKRSLQEHMVRRDRQEGSDGQEESDRGEVKISRRSVIMSMLKACKYTRRDILDAVAEQCEKYRGCENKNQKAISGCIYDLKKHGYVVNEKNGMLYVRGSG